VALLATAYLQAAARAAGFDAPVRPYKPASLVRIVPIDPVSAIVTVSLIGAVMFILSGRGRHSIAS